jgi:pimeloyl-ACP methyl ester carboxylesterase
VARFLLIHGACHGAWCWRDTLPALEALGHEARAIDLPSHGADRTPLAEVTLERYAHAILDALDAPAILVGHSMAGYPITLAAERAPERIARLVYLCAYTPWPGLTLSRMRHEADEQPLLPAIRMSEDGQSFTFDPEMVPDLFYHDCPSEAVAYAQARLCPQAVAASSTAVALTDRSASVPRSYIVCRYDRAIPPQFQEVMARRAAPEDVHFLPTSHSPFFADPEGLAQVLHRIADPGAAT